MAYSVRALVFLVASFGSLSNVMCTTPPDPCSNPDPILDRSAFVFVTSPQVGETAASPIDVRGCSSTFESNVVWELRARNGSVLASGFTMGGGLDGPEPFNFTVTYDVTDRQIGHLEVYETDASDGEGFPPGRVVLPLVLVPSSTTPSP